MRALRTKARAVNVLAAIALAALATLLAPALAAARAGASAWISSEQSQIRLISASAAVGDGRTLRLGVHVRLEPGWKTYWRSPGDAGLPPRFDWSGSVNVARAEVGWPAPKRFTLFGLDSFVYGDEVVYPITVTLARPGQAVSFRLKADYAVCKNICVPYQAVLALDVPAGAAAETPYRRLIERYLRRVPARGSSDQLSLESVALRGSDSGPMLEVRARAKRPFAAPDLLVEGPVGVTFAAPEVELGEGGLSALFRVAVRAGREKATLAGRPLTLTLIDGARALEREMVAAPAE